VIPFTSLPTLPPVLAGEERSEHLTTHPHTSSPATVSRAVPPTGTDRVTAAPDRVAAAVDKVAVAVAVAVDRIAVAPHKIAAAADRVAAGKIVAVADRVAWGQRSNTVAAAVPAARHSDPGSDRLLKRRHRP